MAALSGTAESRRIAKDFANQLRLSRMEWTRVDTELKNNFTAGEREAMWIAADEESVARQQGRPTQGIGLSRLTPEQRAAVEALQAAAKATWEQAKALGMVEGKDCPPTPRACSSTRHQTRKAPEGCLQSVGTSKRRPRR